MSLQTETANKQTQLVEHYPINYGSYPAFMKHRRFKEEISMNLLAIRRFVCLFVQRQVGFDRQRRPVIYACFAQATCSDTTIDDTLVHMTHLFENAQKLMTGDVSTWVLVVDCTGQ